MSARENMSALLATRGKGGSIEAITQASVHYSNDTSLAPTDFISAGEKLEASKAIVLLGGYVTKQYGIAPKDVFSMRNVISKKYLDVLESFSQDKEGFLATITELEGEMATEFLTQATLESSLGTDAEGYIKSAQKQIDKIAFIASPKVRYELEQLVATINAKLEYNKVSAVVSA